MSVRRDTARLPYTTSLKAAAAECLRFHFFDERHNGLEIERQRIEINLESTILTITNFLTVRIIVFGRSGAN